MKRMIFIPLLCIFSLTCQKTAPNPEAESLLAQLKTAGDVIVAKKVAQDIPLDPHAPVWQEAQEVVISLVPQNAVSPATNVAQKRNLTLRALTHENELGLLLTWEDTTNDMTVLENQAFADAVAVAFPVNYGEGNKLPYIGMGNVGRPVNIWHWKAAWQTDVDKGFTGVDTVSKGQVPTVAPVENSAGLQAGSPLSQRKRTSSVENLLAEGFGTLTSTNDGKLVGKGVWKEGYWHVVIKSLRHSSDQAVNLGTSGLVPITFAVWDGAQAERNGMKGITHWHFLHFADEDVSLPYLQSLLMKPKLKADALRGKQLFSDLGCAACHHVPGAPPATNVGPDLTYSGAIHRSEYLLESIKEPNAVIVPAPGYYTPTSGLSTMPSYEGTLDEGQYNDLVEYLKGLK